MQAIPELFEPHPPHLLPSRGCVAMTNGNCDTASKGEGSKEGREDYGKGDFLANPKRLTQDKRNFDLRGLDNQIHMLYYILPNNYYNIFQGQTFKQPEKMKRFRRTPQRLAIIEFLSGNSSHPSAEEIHAALLRQFPTLSLATVYNTLEALRERGEIVEVGLDPAKKRFDPTPETHHHLICVRCKKIVDIPEKFYPVLTEHEKVGFQVLRSRVEFYGLCPQCQSQKK
jgi:Fur family peroxide stress response transcriptional regulator